MHKCTNDRMLLSLWDNVLCSFLAQEGSKRLLSGPPCSRHWTGQNSTKWDPIFQVLGQVSSTQTVSKSLLWLFCVPFWLNPQWRKRVLILQVRNWGSPELSRTCGVSHDGQALEEGGLEPWLVWPQSTSFCCAWRKEGRAEVLKISEGSQRASQAFHHLRYHSTSVSVTRIILWSYQLAEKYERKEPFSPLHSQLTSQPKVNLCSGFLCPSPQIFCLVCVFNLCLKLAEEEGRSSKGRNGLCSRSSHVFLCLEGRLG